MDDKTALGLLEAKAVPTFAPISNASPIFFKTFFAVLFDTVFLTLIFEEVTKTINLFRVYH